MTFDKLKWYAEYAFNTCFGIIREGAYCESFDSAVNKAIESGQMCWEECDGKVYDVRLHHGSLVGVWATNKWYSYGVAVVYEKIPLLGGPEIFMFMDTTQYRISIATMYKLQKYLKERGV